MGSNAPWQERAKELLDQAEHFSRPVGACLSLALLIVVFKEAAHADMGVVHQVASFNPAFFVTLGMYYLLAPATEWYLYAKLWRSDRRLFPALLRKFVYNELMLDYLGDVQFLAWAQSRFRDHKPLASIKDVTILSALTGNVVTVLLIGCAWPLVAKGLGGVAVGTIFNSLTVLVGVSSLTLLFSRRIFTHPPGTLWWIAATLVGRAVMATILSAVLWHLLMPNLPLSSLFVLATLRMMVSRLPLVPSKDLLFAGIAVVVFGQMGHISASTATIASLMLALHLVFALVLAGSQLSRRA